MTICSSVIVSSVNIWMKFGVSRSHRTPSRFMVFHVPKGNGPSGIFCRSLRGTVPKYGRCIDPDLVDDCSVRIFRSERESRCRASEPPDVGGKDETRSVEIVCSRWSNEVEVGYLRLTPEVVTPGRRWPNRGGRTGAESGAESGRPHRLRRALLYQSRGVQPPFYCSSNLILPLARGSFLME
jgi:hypothetical protein